MGRNRILDEELDFLDKCSNEDLEVLVKILTHDIDGNERITEELTSTYSYKQHYPNHKMYLPLIKDEIHDYGGNTFMNIFRGNGVKYKEILIDCAKKMKVNFNSKNSVEDIEQYLLMKVLEESLEKTSLEELKKLLEELDIKTTNFTKQAIIAAIQMTIKKGGFKTYKIAVIVANSLSKQIMGKGLSFTANSILTKSISKIPSPIGLVLNGLWVAVDIAGPAYRVTIPICIYMAYLRA